MKISRGHLGATFLSLLFGLVFYLFFLFKVSAKKKPTEQSIRDDIYFPSPHSELSIFFFQFGNVPICACCVSVSVCTVCVCGFGQRLPLLLRGRTCRRDLPQL